MLVVEACWVNAGDTTYVCMSDSVVCLCVWLLRYQLQILLRLEVEAVCNDTDTAASSTDTLNEVIHYITILMIILLFIIIVLLFLAHWHKATDRHDNVEVRAMCSIGQQMTAWERDCGQLRPTNWLCVGRDCQRLETALSASLHLAFGTVCRHASPQRKHCQPSRNI